MSQDEKNQPIVTIHPGGEELSFAALSPDPNGSKKILVSCSSQHLEISEKDLVDLLQKGVREGILSTEFISDLRSEFLI